MQILASVFRCTQRFALPQPPPSRQATDPPSLSQKSRKVSEATIKNLEAFVPARLQRTALPKASVRWPWMEIQNLSKHPGSVLKWHLTDSEHEAWFPCLALLQHFAGVMICNQTDLGYGVFSLPGFLSLRKIRQCWPRYSDLLCLQRFCSSKVCAEHFAQIFATNGIHLVRRAPVRRSCYMLVMPFAEIVPTADSFPACTT